MLSARWQLGGFARRFLDYCADATIVLSVQCAGVRARQQKLPFVACQDPSAFAYFAARSGQWLQVEADSESFHCKELTADEAAAAVAEQQKARILQRHIDDDEHEFSLGRQVNPVSRGYFPLPSG